MFVIAMIFEGCTSVKNTFAKSGNDQDDAIQIAILDFSKTPKLLKNDAVFSVELVGLSTNNNIMVVRIGKNNRKLLLTKDTKIGSKGKLPSRYVEKEGRLFFWWDDGYPLTEQALGIYKKYNLLQDDENGRVTIPDFIIDDAQKAAHYYFCKNEVSSFKRVITNKGVGYYTPPDIKCK